MKLWNSRLKRQISRLKYWRIMQNAEFANSTQTTIFYIEDLFQIVFMTSIKPQIIQKRIKSHQRTNFLVFLSFQRVSKRVRWGKDRCTTVFKLVHSITELHPVYQDNLSPIFTIFKIFTNHTPRLHFWIKTRTRFLTHTKI